MSDQEEYKVEQALKMKHDWDLRAGQDALYYIIDSPKPYRLPEFLERGREQAYELTCNTFRELDFDPKGKRMLEIGCGIGRLFPGFTEMFEEVWGVDVSDEMIKRAEEIHNSANVRLLQNNGYDLAGICDNHFDFAFSYIVFQHIPAEWMVFSYLAETYRVLKPGGAFQFHFRTNWVSLRGRIFFRLPHVLRRPAEILYRLFLLYPLRHLPLRNPSIPGDEASWVGTGFSRTQIEVELTRLGFDKVMTLADEKYPDGKKFWAIGRKPNEHTTTGAIE